MQNSTKFAVAVLICAIWIFALGCGSSSVGGTGTVTQMPHGEDRSWVEQSVSEMPANVSIEEFVQRIAAAKQAHEAGRASVR